MICTAHRQDGALDEDEEDVVADADPDPACADPADPPHGPRYRLRLLATLIAQEIRRGGHGTPPAQAAPSATPPRPPRRSAPIRCSSRP